MARPMRMGSSVAIPQASGHMTRPFRPARRVYLILVDFPILGNLMRHGRNYLEALKYQFLHGNCRSSIEENMRGKISVRSHRKVLGNLHRAAWESLVMPLLPEARRAGVNLRPKSPLVPQMLW
jgi:hypothetical protein